MQTDIRLTEDEKTYIVLKGNDITDEEKARIIQRAYQREWSRKNKDRMKKIRQKCLAKKFDILAERELGDDYE